MEMIENFIFFFFASLMFGVLTVLAASALCEWLGGHGAFEALKAKRGWRDWVKVFAVGALIYMYVDVYIWK